MAPEDFDRDMFGFAISLAGMAICSLGSCVWNLFI